MGYELLHQVGDDPLSELAEMDHFYRWSYRIAKLRGLFERKRRTDAWLTAGLLLILALTLCLIGTFAFLYFFF
ncbi:MAG: hypothetical protein JXA22_00915 [Candidatus Thermoplasmatota archaeon]|nr:hypothetical protein [Candidatus Thermoplasmatota archaeon]